MSLKVDNKPNKKKKKNGTMLKMDVVECFEYPVFFGLDIFVHLQKQLYSEIRIITMHTYIAIRSIEFVSTNENKYYSDVCQ